MFKRKDATRVSLAYRYHNPKWDLAQNLLIYGADHNVEGIGGNLSLWLEVAGAIDAQTRLLIPEKSLDGSLARLKSRLDHRCLFEAEPWFADHVPTLENIAIFLTQNLPLNRDWYSLTVEENENWRVQLFKQERLPQLTYSILQNGLRFEITIEGPVDPESGLIERRASLQVPIQEWLQNLDRLSMVEIEILQKQIPRLVTVRARNATKTAMEWSLA